MRYQRLQHLLERSNFFSDFLLEKMTKELNMGSCIGLSSHDQEAGRRRKRKMKCKAGERKAKRSAFEDGSEKIPDFKAVFSQPKLLTGGTLRPYQLEGANWLRVLYENGIHGILGDEMGLGKTVQCIALLAHLIEMQVTGPFLVAAPLSTLPNWVAEFKRFAPTIPTLLYHGSKADRKYLRDELLVLHTIPTPAKTRIYPVVITSYEIIMKDRVHLEKLAWKYLIVDEGHRIKNLNCRLVQELKRYKTANRLLLTGTPLQNNLAELWSLLNFLLPDIFDDLNTFQSWFDFTNIGQTESTAKIITLEREKHVLNMLHKILTPFLLRRLKSDVELEIPPKKEIIVYAPLSRTQQLLYKACLDQTLIRYMDRKEGETVSQYIEQKEAEIVSLNRQVGKENPSDTKPSCRPQRRAAKPLVSLNEDSLWDTAVSGKSVSNSVKGKCVTSSSEVNIKVCNMQMQMRKVCNHPYLIEYPLTEGQYRVDEELVTSCGKMKLLDCLLPALKHDGHKILLFSQMTSLLDIVEDYLMMRNYNYCRLDGSTHFLDRQVQIEQFNTDPDVFIFLLSTRAGGLGLNLTSADTVIIYDSDWNPQGDVQAQDRCHRISQTKPVVVYRLVTANTIDQRMVERAATKRKLEKLVIHRKQFKGDHVGSDAVTLDSLLELLQSNEHDAEVNWAAGGQFLNDKDLKFLLDRTALGEQSTHSHKLFQVVDEAPSSSLLPGVSGLS
jgi:ATP-dependent DNA helicase